ncbi:MAG: class I SAM-dependent methyltransferase [Candidatus Eisenbacteria bacterium]
MEQIPVREVFEDFDIEFYEREAARRGSVWSCSSKEEQFFNEATRFHSVRDLIHRYLPHGRILDAACGDGYLLHMLGRAGAFELFGVDLSMRRLNRIPPTTREHNTGLVQGNVCCLPVKDQTFDGCVVSEILEHLGDTSALAEAYRALKPDGYLFATVPYKEQIVHYTCPHCRTRFNPSGHVRVYDEQGLRETLKAHGFIVEESGVLCSTHLKRLRGITERYLRIKPAFGSYYTGLDRWFSRRWPDACTYLAMVGRKPAG